MAYDPDNIFARILRGDIPAHKVFEDAATLAFMDVMPQSEGHTLVIPKTAAENLFDLPAADLALLIQATQKVATAVRTAVATFCVAWMSRPRSAAGRSNRFSAAVFGITSV